MTTLRLGHGFGCTGATAALAPAVAPPAEEAETAALIAEMTAAGAGAEPVYRTAINGFYVSAKATTWWAKCIDLTVGAADEVAMVRADWKAPGAATRKAINGTLTFTAKLGFHGNNNAANFLRPVINPSTDIPRTGNALILGLASGSATAGDDAGSTSQFQLRWTTAATFNMNTRNARAVGSSTTVNPIVPPGRMISNRTGATTHQYGHNGAAMVALDTNADASITNTSYDIGRGLGLAGGARFISDHAIFNAALSDAEWASYNTIMSALIAAIAAS